jgi:urocanate hydratase
MLQVFPQLLKMDVPIDIVTDQTSAHDPLSYVPIGIEFDQAAPLQKISQRSSHFALKRRWQNMCRRWLALWIRVLRFLITVTQLGMKHVRVALIVPLLFLVLCPHISDHYFVKAKDHLDGWHSEDPEDIYKTDKAVLDLFPENQALHRSDNNGARKSSLPRIAGTNLLVGIW